MHRFINRPKFRPPVQNPVLRTANHNSADSDRTVNERDLDGRFLGRGGGILVGRAVFRTVRQGMAFLGNTNISQQCRNINGMNISQDHFPRILTPTNRRPLRACFASSLETPIFDIKGKDIYEARTCDLSCDPCYDLYDPFCDPSYDPRIPHRVFAAVVRIDAVF